MYGYYTDHLYIASVDGLPEYTGDTVTSAIILYDNDLLIPGKKISVNGVEYTLNSNGIANVTLGPHDAPGDYPLVVKVNGTTVLDQTYPVAQTTYTATSSGSFTQYEQGTLTITAKRNGVAYSGAATLAGKAITFTNGKATYTTTYNTSGKQSLKLVIDGQTITLSVTVAAATYSVEAEDYTVQEYESEAVSFTVKRNGKPYQGAVTLAHNSNITSSTKSTTSNASGLVSITVTGATAGASTISATFGGGTVSDAVSVTVTEATYTASITPKTVQRFEDAEITITAKRNGKAYAGAITLAYSGGVSGDTKVTTNSSGTGTFTITGNTVGSGTITATYGGGSVKLSATVTAATYTLAISNDEFTQYEAGSTVVTVTRNGKAYAGKGTINGTSVTFSAGKYTYKATYEDTGTETLTVKVDDWTDTADITVAAATYAINASSKTITAYEEADYTITVTRNGKAYAGAVTLAYSGGITGTPAKATSNASGQFDITLTSTGTADGTVKATFGGGSASYTVDTQAATYAAEITSAALKTNVSGTITATVKRNGKNYSGAVTVKYPTGISGTTSATATDGVVKLTATATTAGNKTLTFTFGGGSATDAVSVTASTYSFVVSPTTIRVDETKSITGTVKRNNAAYAGAVTLTYSGGLSGPASATANSSGQFTINVSADATGTGTIKATFGGGNASDTMTISAATYVASANSTSVQAYNSKSVTFTVKKNDAVYAGAVTIKYSGNLSGPASATANASGQFTISVAASGTTAGNITLTYGGGSDAIAFTVTAATYTLAISNDEFTQYEAGSTVVTVTRNGKAYAGKGTINGTSVTFSAGKYTYKATYEDTGTETLTVKVDDWTDTADITVAAATYAINASSKTITAYEEADYTITVTRNGKAYAGAVTLAYSGGITGTPAKATSNASGQFDITLTSTGTADGTVKATFGGGSASYTVDTQAATYAAEITSAALKTNVSGTITATVKRNGKNYSGAVTVKYPTGISGTTSATATDGVVKLTATATTAGNKTLTFTFGGGSATDAVSVTASTYSFVVSPTTIRVDETKSITGTVKRNNAAYAGAVTLTYSGGLSGPASATANSSGQFTINVSADATGTGTIKATFGGGNASDTMTISAATYVASANSTSVQAYNSKSVTFTVKKNDAVYAGAVTIKYSGNLSGPASATANASGQFTISVAASGTTAGNITLTYGGGSDAIAFTVSAATYTVSASPTALTEDLASNVTFTVKRNNVAYDGAVTFSLPSGLSGSTSATATDGKCTNKLTATTTGNKTVTVSFGGGSATATFTVAAATYAASANISQLYTNDPDSVTFTVKKNNANYAGSVSLSYSSGLSGPASATASGGTFTVSLTATTTGSKTVTLSFGGGTSTVSFSVSASTYALTLTSPTNVKTGVPEPVTFNVTMNNKPYTGPVQLTSNISQVPAQTINAQNGVGSTTITFTVHGDYTIYLSVGDLTTQYNYSTTALTYEYVSLGDDITGWTCPPSAPLYLYWHGVRVYQANGPDTTSTRIQASNGKVYYKGVHQSMYSYSIAEYDH